MALFGPTGVGKTEVAVALAEQLRERGEDPVAVGCDAIQIYRGLEVLSGGPTPEQRARLEHRLVSFVEVDEEFSAGRFAELARAEVDSLLTEGRRPIVVGGTGLYMRASLAELDLQPPVPAAVRDRVEREIAVRGAPALHTELEADVRARVHPHDRKRVGRALELQRSGLDPPERGGELWTAQLRHPTRLFGLVIDRGLLARRIDRRVETMAAGARKEVERAERTGASRTARAALGYAELRAGDIEAMKAAHRRFARRQLTWMRRMEGVEPLDVSRRSASQVASEIAASLVPKQE